jgi:hypothetical protein
VLLLSACSAGSVVNDADVSPGMSTPFLCHWYASGKDPLALTVNVAVRPMSTL